MEELNEKDRLLQEALKVIEKEFGEGSLILLGEHVAVRKDVIHTGSIGLDHALGIGGYPRGKVVEIYGEEASGKTTICLHAIKESQKAGGTCAYIDVEHALDPAYAELIGVDVDRLYLSQPDDGEQALGICEALVDSRAFDLVVVDSAAALVPKKELDGEMGENHEGLQAGMLAKSLRKLVESAMRTKATVIFTNQLRYRNDASGTFEITPGGRALKFHAAVRIETQNVELIKEKGNIIGEQVCLTIRKNKSAPPFKKAEVIIIYGKGVSREDEIIDYCVEYGIFDKFGAWYSYNGKKIGKGRDNTRKYLVEHPEEKEEIEKELFSMVNYPRLKS